MSLGGPFSLTDQTGRAVTERDFAGRWMLVYFGYTFCPDVCPTELGTMAAALDAHGPGGGGGGAASSSPSTRSATRPRRWPTMSAASTRACWA